jgi:3-deoxy-D-manno-octulosonate 8-phosphate phosphatase (KDO 8-P phosphatase)
MRLRTGHKPRTPRVRPARGPGESLPVPLDRLRKIEAVVLDCDGVLTSGDLLYDESGRRLLTFYARDGAGIAMLVRSGVHVAILTGRPADIAELRHRELGVKLVRHAHDKGAALEEMCQELGVEPGACAFVGDDLPDLPAFRVAGLRVAVANAVPEVIARADWVTQNDGGRGAVREVCEAILKARGAWEELLDRLDGEP